MPFIPDSRTLRSWAGLVRSIVVYYGNPVKLRRMQRFYGQFIGPGDLCFDIGAHVGNRLFVWSRLGARVVGVEPQPLCIDLLRRWYGRAPNITLVDEAIGAAAGHQTLWVSESSPTVTTLSRTWIDAVQRASSFAQVRWEDAVTVPVTTLDNLIERCGEPTFCKIDVEGYEAEVLRGLTHPLRTLSFEYVPAARDVALECIEQLQQLGEYIFNWSYGEEHRWHSTQWVGPQDVTSFLCNLSVDDRSGDIYARNIADRRRPARPSSLFDP